MQRIDFVSYKSLSRARVSQTSFSFNPEKGYVWLQKVLFRILKKLGCESKYTELDVVKTESIYFDSEDLIRNILEQDRIINKHFNLRHYCRIVMGPDEFYKVARQQHAPMQPFSINARTENKLFGMHIQVIPWMSGILLLPDEEDHGRSRDPYQSSNPFKI